MRHDKPWFALMVVTILLLLTATGSAQLLFFVSAIGLVGALLAARQSVDRHAILVSVIGGIIACVIGLVLVLLPHR